MKVKDRTKERSVKKSYNETNKHEKAKKNFFNEKQPKGNKGNHRWNDVDDDY